MDYMTITQVSKQLGLSTRTLRYYEQIGLIESVRTQDYAYRTYTPQMVQKLAQIIILKKLHIPLKDIKVILEDGNITQTMLILQNKIAVLGEQIQSTALVKDILSELVDKLSSIKQLEYTAIELDDNDIKSIIEISSSKTIEKEGFLMEQLNAAQKKLNQMADVRIVTLPPMTVASYHFIGEMPEQTVMDKLNQFVIDEGLLAKKPDMRCFGFNNPNPSAENPTYGYEMWLTIPKDTHCKAPIVKKEIPARLYAVHTIDLGNFTGIDQLLEWVNSSQEYEADIAGAENMHGILEEQVDYYGYMMSDKTQQFPKQVDVYMPIKKKQ